jgi:SpoVK/Ycf46/Vps4 family AAA+-type ATPase
MSSAISSFDIGLLNNLQDGFMSIKNYLKENGSLLASTPTKNEPIKSSLILDYFKNNKEKIWQTLLGLTISATMSYFFFKWLLKSFDPTNADKLASKKIAEKIMKDLGINNIELNEYELCIASNIILPQNIDCSWQDIGGLEHIINDLKETVIYPLRNLEFDDLNLNNKRSRLIQPPKGYI